MLGRDGTEVNRRDKAIMTSIMSSRDLPKVRESWRVWPTRR